MQSLSQTSSRTSPSQTSNKRCDCGFPSPMKTSSTPVNFGRKFYECGKLEETGRRGCKYFEWVDINNLENGNVESWWNEWEEEMVLLRAREAEMIEELKKLKELLMLNEKEMNAYKNDIVKLKLELKKYKEKESGKSKCSCKKYVIFIFLVAVVIYLVNGSRKWNRSGKEIMCLA